MHILSSHTRRWYPLSYPGCWTDTLSVAGDTTWEHCTADISACRGKSIGLSLHCPEGSDGVCVLTDETGAVLAYWQDPPASITVPDAARRLYLSNRHTVQPDFYLTVPADTLPHPNGLLFYEDFTQPEALDPNDFLHAESPAARCTEEGLIPGTGPENAVVIHRSVSTDACSFTVEFTAPTLTETLYLGSRITQPRSCRHASLCSVDLAAGVLRLHGGCTGTELPDKTVGSVDVTSLLRDDHRDFLLRLQRSDDGIRAVFINCHTGAEASVTEPLFPEETETTIAGACRAGKLYDTPQLFAGEGRPVIRRFYGAAKTTPKVMFFGDSLTQGAHNLPRDGWAQRSAAYFGSSMCCGRGSGDIWSCLNQVRSLVPVCRPKAMVITIGTNNSPDVPASLYRKFLHMAAYWGIIPIVNCIPACGKRPHVETMNRTLRQLPCLKCRFDLVTTEDNEPGGTQIADYYVADATHLSGAGNEALYRRFTRDFHWLKDL